MTLLLLLAACTPVQVTMDCVTILYADVDGDGYGDPNVTTVGCSPGEGFAANGRDCDDSDPERNPDAFWYRDADGDGYGVTTDPVPACNDIVGYSWADGDCDDGDGARHPDADEYCDDVDQDCDGLFYESDSVDAKLCYVDRDRDGWGGDETDWTCEYASGCVEQTGDCEDSEAEMYPGHEEVCDHWDNDCDSVVDEDPTDGTTYYPDTDGDGYGSDADGAGEQFCEAPDDAWALNDGDCDDTTDAVSPADEEICEDGVDNNCRDGDAECPDTGG